VNLLAESPQSLPVSAEHPLQKHAMRALAELPPFSPILSCLLATMADEEVSFTELADLIEKDTVMAGSVLQLVNSALYKRRNTVTSIRYAVSMLGANKVRNIALGMQVAGVWNRAKCPPGLSLSQFNKHAAAVAILSDLIAQHMPVEYPEGAFVAGLLHDVGRLLLAVGLPDEFMELLKIQAATGVPLVECERSRIGCTHADLSEWALRQWKLPPPVQKAVGRHHDPETSGGAQVALSRVIAAADGYANRAGVSTFAPAWQAEPGADLDPIEALGLPHSRVEQIVADFQRDFEATAQFFR
jgi:HD-like signal output (HDOD) protein